jgi:uncharacterized membrane protein
MPGNPVHLMVVHLPILFWICAVAADLVGLFTHASQLARP